MSSVKVIAARVLGLFGYRRLDRELDDEIRFHLEMQTEDNVLSGMDPTEARYAASRSFGPIEPVKERHRERRAIIWIATAGQDIRYAARTLRNNAAFTIASTITLALAIGVNTVMFSILNAVLLRPLPYRSPEQLAMLWTEIPNQNLREGRTGYWNVEAWRHSNSFTDMAVLDGVSATLTSTDSAQRISVVRCSPNFFSVLGVQPSAGRMFSTEEAEQRQRVLLISHRFWQSHFAGSTAAIGSSIEINGVPSRIIGILPERFYFPKLDVDAWEPHTMFPDWQARRAVRGADTWSVVARLRPDVTFERAQAEMNTIARQLDVEMPLAERGRGISVVPLTFHAVGRQLRFGLWMLCAAVLCVLLIAAFNVASLSLARTIGRTRELAIRAALGASRLRIVRQLLTEGATLAFMSGVLGTLLSVAGVDLIRSLDLIAAVRLPRLNEVSLDLRVLGVAAALSFFTGILVGLAPAMTVWRRNLHTSMDEGGRGASSGIAARGLRRTLVVAELALAIILLVAAGLFVQSWQRVESVDSGFKPERVLTIALGTPVGMPPPQRSNLYNQVLADIETLPNVESAGLTSDLFITNVQEQVLTTEGDLRTNPDRLQFRRDEVSTNFFKAVGSPLLRGRFFSRQDRLDSPRVVIINEALAKRLWPESDPVQKRFKVGSVDSDGPWFTVIGVVGNMRRQGLEREPIPQFFEPLTQNPPGGGLLLIRTSMEDPLKIAAAVETTVRRSEKHALVYGAATFEKRLEAFLTPRRFQALLLVGFSSVALLMAAIGVYGLIQYSVATRKKEIGIRMAVGAQASEIFRMILGEGLRLTLIGLALGLMGALIVGRALSSLLFGVTATDPLTLTGVPVLMTAVAAAACYFPARRAAKIEPVLALRQQ